MALGVKVERPQRREDERPWGRGPRYAELFRLSVAPLGHQVGPPGSLAEREGVLQQARLL